MHPPLSKEYLPGCGAASTFIFDIANSSPALLLLVVPANDVLPFLLLSLSADVSHFLHLLGDARREILETWEEADGHSRRSGVVLRGRVK